MAVFIGPSGISPWHNEEMRAALKRAISQRDDKRIIPVLLPGADPQTLPLFLQARTWVDFRSVLQDDRAFDRLISAI